MVVGLGRFELPTSRLSGVRSNQLSYRPVKWSARSKREIRPKATCRRNRLSKEPKDQVPWKLNRIVHLNNNRFLRPRRYPSQPGFDPRRWELLRKEVIQPQVLLQLPCYDFTPITDHTLGGCLPCGLAHRLLVQPTFVM